MPLNGTMTSSPAVTSANQNTSLQDNERWPWYDAESIAAATACLSSGRVNQWTGDRVRAFETRYAEILGRPTIALANGSLALELALRAFGIGPGDEVVVSPRSFVASASCVLLVGATPVFADVDPASGNLSPETIAQKLGPRTKAVIVVHLAGWPADLPGIAALLDPLGVRLIEDCAQAHGAEIMGRPVGTWGAAAAFSFCQDKIITTGGEGGLLSFADQALHEWAWSYKDHGKSGEKMRRPVATPGYKWVHDQLGTNWRMLEMSAAIGLRQLDLLSEWRSRRAALAAVYRDALSAIPGVEVPMPAAEVTHAFYRLYAYLPSTPDVEQRRNMLLARCNAAGLRVFVGSCGELYREGVFADLGVAPLPIAADLARRGIAVELHPTLEPARVAARATRLAGLIADCLADRSDASVETGERGSAR